MIVPWLLTKLLCLYHAAYGLRPVWSPQNLPQIWSHTVSVYGLHGQLSRSLRSRTVARTACTVARTVSTVGRTVYMVSCYGHPERYRVAE